MHAAEVLHGLAVVDQVGVEGAMLGHGQRAGDHVEHDVVDGDLVHAEGLALGLEHGAGRLDLGGVAGDVVGQLRHGGQGGDHGLGDHLAHVAHGLGVAVVAGHALFDRSSGNRCRSLGRSRCADDLARVDQGLHVALDHAAVGAGGHDLGQIGLALLRQRLGARGDLDLAHDHGGLGDLRCGGRFDGALFLDGGAQVGVAILGGTELLKVVAGLADDADVEQAGNVVALLEEVGQQRAGNLGGLLKGSLVGLIGEQHVADFDLVAGLLLELVDDAALHGVALAGHDHRNRVALPGLGCAGRLRGGCCGCGCGSGGHVGVAVLVGTELLEILAGVADDADVQQAGHIVALLEEVRQQRAGNLGLLLEGSLVGFIAEQHVADFHLVARVLLELIDDTAFDSVALSRHNYWNCHCDASSRILNLPIIQVLTCIHLLYQSAKQ